ncbi:MAG: hypothetical protein AMJ46_14030 [Latescibacteria bacterium DG_63]|nr:MAG: hypothetical protein AMJ46_14030 [Latescibacteria bacterium DG_63]
MILEDGNETQYPRARIYEPGGISPIATLDLDHQVDGRYESSWTPSAVGAFSAHFIVYSDAAHTIENIVYSREVEQIFASASDVDDLAAAIVRLLGLSHENTYIDNTDFDAFGQLISSRIRLYDSKANAQAATDGGSETVGLIAVYTMTADYEGAGRLKSYRYVRDA